MPSGVPQNEPKTTPNGPKRPQKETNSDPKRPQEWPKSDKNVISNRKTKTGPNQDDPKTVLDRPPADYH